MSNHDKAIDAACKAYDDAARPETCALIDILAMRRAIAAFLREWECGISKWDLAVTAAAKQTADELESDNVR